MTLCLPTLATGIHIVVTMARIEPAVVDGPNDGNSALAQIAEEHRIIEEIAVYVVDVYDVGLQLLKPMHKSTCSGSRTEAVTVEETCFETVDSHIKFVSDRYDVRRAKAQSVASATVGNVAVPSCGHDAVAYFLHDAPRGGRSA